MGVAGLWEANLAVSDGFVANPGGRRGFRIGIDASIWFFHAAYGREGENPELRTLFFRCCRLLQSPLLPLFVFDGPKRPAVKRGKRVGGNTHWLTTGMKNIIHAFGFEWRMAPGEAEAELAYLNRIGIIDAVLSDDVDNFLFGATMVIRNPSSTLSGNRSHPVKNSEGRDDGNHVLTYRASSISSHPLVQITRGGAILIALLSGGDYIPAGLPGCGRAFAAGLARAGLGESLIQGATTLKGERLDEFLSQWRNQIRAELRSNKSGFLPSKKPSLAASLPDSFPSIPVLLSYVSPITSETERPRHPSPPVLWLSDPDPAQIASLCELYFEWGVKDIIIKRFRTVLWPGIVVILVNRDHSTSLPTEVAFESSSIGSSPPDGTPEYRVLIDPSALVNRAASGVRGIRPPLDMPTASEDGGDEEVDEDEACMLMAAATAQNDSRQLYNQRLRSELSARTVVPDLVEAYETTARRRAEKKASKRTKDSSTEKTSAKSKGTAVNTANAPSTVPLATTASKPKRFTGKSRRKPKGVAEAQDEGYEYFNLSDASTCSEDEPVNAKGKGKGTTHARTVKRHPESRLTAEDCFPVTNPATSGRVSNLRSLSPDKFGEDRVLPETSLPAESACIRPLDILRHRTKAKSKGSTKPPAVQDEGGEPTFVQRAPSPTCVPPAVASPKKPLVVRKPPLYVDVSSDEVEIAEVRTVAANAPVVRRAEYRLR
ncbi:hypothetical protein EDC04DRAFT_3091706 [Pisolithus marmoratus]|nr:hypothetical protein EDC04DRAFT_3091706 [Pisolithus marmoratus]